jgi:hypothetical protein
MKRSKNVHEIFKLKYLKTEWFAETLTLKDAVERLETQGSRYGHGHRAGDGLGHGHMTKTLYSL